MSFLSRFWLMPLLVTTVVLSTTGCPPKGQTANQADAQNQAIDPAAGNLASADTNTAANASYSVSSTSAESAAPAYYAPKPPPPLPYYEQPPAPGDGYIWTPGYWGPHIGYYGGINYGFGYIGFGYQGGYWGGGNFNYNRSYNNVNVSFMHNVYDRPMRDDRRGGERVSFNGGSGGIQMQARPAEQAAWREQHAAPMGAQMRNEHRASTNRAQFANVNHGRPTNMAVNQPLAADYNVKVPAAAQMRNQATQQHQQRQGVQQQQHQQGSPQQHQAVQQRQQHQAAPQQQRQATSPQQHKAAPQQQRHQAAQQHQQRQAVQHQHQAAPQQQQRQAAPQQQRQQQHQAAPQQQRQAAPQQQHQSAPQQQKAAPQSKDEQHPKK